MVDATSAVHIAEEALGSVVPTFAALKPHVEEVEKSSEGDSWLVTFRAENPEPKPEKRGFGEIFFPYLEKVVRIQITDGNLLSVRNPSYE